MLATVQSKNSVTIRLTDERWTHISEEHCELAGLRLEVLETVENPDRVLAGGAGEYLDHRESGTDMDMRIPVSECKFLGRVQD